MKTKFRHVFQNTRRLLMAAITLAITTFAYADNTYGLPDRIEDGVILHCFDWKYTDIQAELENIAKAGFTAVQTSPAQANRNYRTIWYDAYRPWDFVIGTTILGSKEDLRSLCTAAHTYGIKVIVDVVANHTTSFNTEINNCPAYWQDLSHYHTEGGISDYNNRYQVTHHNIGMHDIRTEDTDNQQRIKAYVQELKSVGVDGIRWDAAKHIGVPSEDDGFWPAVIDGDMYNYGEILGSPGGNADDILAEYWQFMSITDSNYGTNTVLKSLKNGSIPILSGNHSSKYGTKKLVYWGESHDTFCNSGDASVGIEQNVVDRAYAIVASRNGIPALYFSRPNGGTSAGPSACMGDKGSLHFMDKEVAEVNKFHNKLAGQQEAYATRSGVASICRAGGAVIVRSSGSGLTTATNAGSLTKEGSYIDQISGNVFTITASEITGTVGPTGIAVLYEGEGSETDPDVLPDCATWIDGQTFCYFEAPASWTTVNVWAWPDGGDGRDYVGTAWPGPALTQTVGIAANGNTVYLWTRPDGQTTDPTGIIFSTDEGNTKAGGGNLVFVNGGYYDANGLQAVVTGIDMPVHTISMTAGRRWYTLDGLPAPLPLRQGIYLNGGRKYIIK